MRMRIVALVIVGAVSMPVMADEDSTQESVDPPAAQSARKLDLRLPDIRTIFSQEAIDRVVAGTYDRDSLADVEVERPRDRITPRSPAVSSGIFAPFWAFAHPADAWRIFAPIPPDRAALMASTPDATDLNRAAFRPRGIGIGD